LTVSTALRLVLVMVLWAGCFPFITLGLDMAPHLAFATLRAVLAGLVLILIGAMLHRPLPSGRRSWSLITLTGLGATTLGFLGMFHAAEFVSPGIASVIANSQPLLTVGLAYLFLDERIGSIGIAGIVAGFLGILAIASPGLSGGDTQAYALGVAYIILAAVGVAIGNIAIKRLPDDVDGLMAMGFQLLIGSVALGVFAVSTEDLRSMVWTGDFVIILVVLSTLGTSAVFWLWFSTLRHVALSRAVAFTFLIPLFGLVIGSVLFDERLGRVEILGASLIVAGILAVQFSGPSRQRKSA